MEDFFKHLPPTGDFADCAEMAAYESLPEDWTVLVADVQGSTQAIEQGRYKAINMIGAASITAVLNAAGDVEIPYVFGGDGATLAVPPSVLPAAREALVRLACMSELEFGFPLRVGGAGVVEIRARGGDVLVRKLALSPGNHLAFFAGGGVELADRLIKDPAPDNPYRFPVPLGRPPADLEGLSCRWEPLAAQRGVMLSILVKAVKDGEEPATLKAVLDGLSEVLGGDPSAHAPASAGSMRFRWPPRGLWLEAKATAGPGGPFRRYIAIFLESLLQFLCERFRLKMGSYNGATYSGELRQNTDFRKYDDVLRLTLDVGADEADRIDAFLEEAYRAGSLVYGCHRAGSAMMTCLLFSLAESRHVHFIDGGDGGFAMAAKGFKERLKASA